jgi:hypothetical protein
MSGPGMRTMAVGLLGLALAGCDGRAVSGPDGSQIAVVIVDDLMYSQAAYLDPDTRPVGAAYAQVLRFVDCSQGLWRDSHTHVSEYCPLRNGDSNFLQAGTVLYRIDGVDPTEALVVFRTYDVVPVRDPEWVELAPLVNSAGCLFTTTGSLCPPGGTN